MAKRMKYEIAGQLFNKKDELREYIRNILHTYSKGDELSKLHVEFMTEVLERHPQAADKIGVGIETMAIRLNPVYGQKEFYLIRLDGTSTDFSFERCLTPRTALADFKSACRVAIVPDVLAFKNGFWDRQGAAPFHCPFTNEELFFDSCHIDHQPPNTFDQIVMSFIREYGIDVNAQELDGAKMDNSFQLRIANPMIEKQFIQYHKEKATLRVVSKTANLSIIKRDRRVA